MKINATPKVVAEHSRMVAKLAKSGDQIKKSITPEQCHLLHMAIGVSGEVAELFLARTTTDRENQVEEFGDIEFYFRGILDFIELDVQDRPLSVLERPAASQLIITSGEILDLVKKYAVYQKELDTEKLKVECIKFRQVLNELYAQQSIKPDEALEANMQKLLKGKNARYAQGSYSDKQAQERADKAGEK